MQFTRRGYTISPTAWDNIYTDIHTYIHSRVVNIIRTNLVWNADSMIKIAVTTF